MEQKNIEFNGIEYEAKTLIEFSSLARLLFDLAQRQKEFEKKYESVVKDILDKDQRLSEIELKVIGESKSSQKPQISQLNYERKQNNFEGSKLSTINNEQKSEVQEEAFDTISGNKINSDVISKLNKKIKDLEKKLNEFNIKTNTDLAPKIKKNQDNINNTNNQLIQLDKNYEEINKKLIKFNEEFDKIKVKVEDFNIYDIFKGDSGEGGSIDATKALIMNLENKIFKKFSLYDEKMKKSESDFFKANEDIKNIKALIDNFKIQNQRINEKLNEIEKNLNDYMNKNDNKIEEIESNLEFIEQEIKKGIDPNSIWNELDKKIKKLEEEIKKSFNDSLNSIKGVNNNSNDSLINKKILEHEKNIKEMLKSLNELEKNLNENINKTGNLDKMFKEKMSTLEKVLSKKANSTDVSSINERIYGLEEFTKQLNGEIDTLQQYNEKFKSEISNFNKKLEYINGLFEELKSSLGNNKNNDIQFNINDLIDQITFNEHKKENNIKFEKMRILIDDLSRNINDISSSLNMCLTNKDLAQFQNTFMNIFDEFKTNCFKKFMDKHEIHKTFRILEAQIKSLSDTYKKMDGSDNWLLAKKPLNNYQCASCEAMLNDLEKKDNYIAWNKYPNREEKTYRMGHGFSRMLQLVNEEIIKNIENKENKGYVSDEDKKFINNYSNRSKYNDSSAMAENKSIKLPKVKQKSINGDKYGLTVNKFIMHNSPYEEADSISIDKPKISKIYKINNNAKKIGLNKNNSENNNNNISVNTEEKHFHKFKKSGKEDFIQMSMTQPNEKKK